MPILIHIRSFWLQLGLVLLWDHLQVGTQSEGNGTIFRTCCWYASAAALTNDKEPTSTPAGCSSIHQTCQFLFWWLLYGVERFNWPVYNRDSSSINCSDLAEPSTEAPTAEVEVEAGNGAMYAMTSVGVYWKKETTYQTCRQFIFWIMYGSEPRNSPALDPNVPDVMCRLPEARGHCRALIMRWRYDPETGKCYEFGFGGCDGNSNNFPTRKACMDMCAEVR